MWWTWYFSVDMQLFLLAPLMVVLLKKSPKLGYSTIALLCGCSVAAVAIHDSLIASPGLAPAQDTLFFTSVYMKPWARMMPYLIGIAVGSLAYHQI